MAYVGNTSISLGYDLDAKFKDLIIKFIIDYQVKVILNPFISQFFNLVSSKPDSIPIARPTRELKFNIKMNNTAAIL